MTDQDSLKKLILRHLRRLQKLKEQQAVTGFNTAPETLIEIEDLEQKIESLQTELNKEDEISFPPRILVVDNTPDVCETLTGLLTDVGYFVHSARNEAEALEALINQDAFDFAIVDVRLHGEDEEDESGLSLALAIRQLNPRIRVIHLTGYARTKQIVRAVRDYGAADYIDKTQDMGEEILKIIGRYLTR